MAIEEQTEATAPDTTPTDLPAVEQTTDPTTGSEPVEPAADPDAAALAAFNKGMEAVAETPSVPVAVVAKPDAVDATEVAPKPVPSVDADKEVQALGLKGKTEARFRELVTQHNEDAPIREVLEKHGLRDTAKIEEVIESAQRGVEWENAVLSSTATPEQFGTAMNAIRALNSGDPKLMDMAFTEMLGAVQRLGKQLGREVPGLFDALEAHPDLKAEVDAGDLPRQRALELVAQRAQTARYQEVGQRQQQDVQQQQSMQQAMQDISALNDQLKGIDPDFNRKLPYLQPVLDTIRATMQPSQWAGAIKQAYLALPALPAAVPPGQVKPPVGAVPVRSASPGVGLRPKPRTDMEAFEMGMQSVRGA